MAVAVARGGAAAGTGPQADMGRERGAGSREAPQGATHAERGWLGPAEGGQAGIKTLEDAL